MKHLHKIKVLVVDDQEGMRKSLELFLATSDEFEYFNASSGKQCLDFISKNEIDLILLDICMESDLAGIDVAEKIINNNKIKTPEIIFLTSFTEQKYIDQAKILNIPLVDKSITVPEIMEKIKKIFHS